MDATAREKHIAYLLDTHLLHRGRVHLVKLIRKAEGLGVNVPQRLRSFAQKSQQVLISLNKLGRDRRDALSGAQGN